MKIFVPVFLDDCVKDLIRWWWIHHVSSQSNSLLTNSPLLGLYADTSLSGWGPAFGHSRTGGYWAQEELSLVTCLELTAT